jgi:hypothetical protein
MVLGILAARKQRRPAEERAKARSDAIDRQIKAESNIYKRTCSILMMGSSRSLVLYDI